MVDPKNQRRVEEIRHTRGALRIRFPLEAVRRPEMRRRWALALHHRLFLHVPEVGSHVAQLGFPHMTGAVLVAFGIVLCLLSLLVFGLLRSHATILKRLHELDGGEGLPTQADPGPAPVRTDTGSALALPIYPLTRLAQGSVDGCGTHRQ